MRAGLVGYGLAGRHFHAPNLVGAGIDIAAICSRSAEKRNIANAEFPKATLVTSMEELLHEELDLVVIASTNDVHVEQAMAAIDAGIATVVDKPLGRNLKETIDLFEHAEIRGVPLTVFFNRLWDSDIRTAETICRSGELGEIFRFESRAERYRPNLTEGAWRESASVDQGGGLLLDLQTHLVSTALYLFGPAELVHATVRSIRGAADDDVVLSLRHDNGVDSYLSVSSVIGAPGPRIKLCGRNGTLLVNELDRQEALLRKGYGPINGMWPNPSDVTSDARLIAGEKNHSYPALPGNYCDFYIRMREVVENGGELPVTKDLALQVAQILDHARVISTR